MNLVALGDGASYTAASGTVFATSGDPFAPGTVAPVPEPSDFALVGAGLGVLALVGRRRRRDRAQRAPLELAVIEVRLARVDA